LKIYLFFVERKIVFVFLSKFAFVFILPDFGKKILLLEAFIEGRWSLLVTQSRMLNGARSRGAQRERREREDELRPKREKRTRRKKKNNSFSPTCTREREREGEYFLFISLTANWSGEGKEICSDFPFSFSLFSKRERRERVREAVDG